MLRHLESSGKGPTVLTQVEICLFFFSSSVCHGYVSIQFLIIVHYLERQIIHFMHEIIYLQRICHLLLYNGLSGSWNPPCCASKRHFYQERANQKIKYFYVFIQ
jgi:hypothetical protein